MLLIKKVPRKNSEHWNNFTLTNNKAYKVYCTVYTTHDTITVKTVSFLYHSPSENQISTKYKCDDKQRRQQEQQKYQKALQQRQQKQPIYGCWFHDDVAVVENYYTIQRTCLFVKAFSS